MGRPTTKETKVKGAFFKHRGIDASEKEVMMIVEYEMVTSSGCLSSLGIY